MPSSLISHGFHDKGATAQAEYRSVPEKSRSISVKEQMVREILKRADFESPVADLPSVATLAIFE